MKAEFLKIAGVKSEAEFYKKFPSEEAFMKKHGKDIKKLMVKKANIGSLIPNKQTPTSNNNPVRIDEAFLFDTVASQTGKKSYDETLEDMKTQAQINAGQQQQSQGGGGLMSLMPQLMDLFKTGEMPTGGGSGGGGMNGGGMADAMSSFNMKKGGKVKKFEPHMMYDPKTGKGYKANKLADHERMKKLGYLHADEMKKTPKAFMGGDVGGGASGGAGGADTGIFGKISDVYNSKGVQEFGIPIVGDILSIKDQLKQQKEVLAGAKQNRIVSELALRASKTEPEKIDREYVRPEDFANTGEEFFPVYGVGTNVLAKNGGMFSDPGYVPLVNPNQQKSFKQGGVSKAQGGFNMANVSYGGGGAGDLGMQLGDAVGFNNDAGSNIGGKIGGTIGSVFGPIGSAVGSFIGSGIGDLVDRDDRRTAQENRRAEKATKELSYGAIGPAVQAGFASHVRDGGNVPSNPSLLDTMKMGGELKTLWGGKAETVSYNPYAGGESIEFKGNSHNYLDPKTGQTGIGVAYGKDSVANNEAVVEVENEPAQQLKDGGGTENLVVYGDLKIPKEYVPEINDERAKGKKFKKYVEILNKDEKKINNKMEKAANLGLESDNTVFGQLERSTADAILNGSDMKLKAIADKKMILADLQSALNDTFDEYEIKGNNFISKDQIVEDPERVMNNMAKSGIEIKPENRGKFTAWAKERGMSVVEAANKVMANPEKYSKGVVAMANFAKNARNFKKGKDGVDVPKAQGDGQQNTPPNGNFDNQLPTDNKVKKTDKTPEQLIEEGYKQDPDNPNRFIKSDGESVEAVELSIEALEKVPKGQGRDEETGLFGSVTMEQFEEAKKANPWFDWENFDPKNEADVKRYQREFNKRAEEAGDDTRIQVDGDFGEQTSSARFTPAVEGSDPVQDIVEITPEEEEEPNQGRLPIQIPNFMNRNINDDLPADQLLAEKYAMATNQYVPVPTQSYQPRLRVPYDISLQDMRNNVISQSRALQRNPVLQNNPAALALAQAPTYQALNQINAEEFRMNQQMKDAVYSGNLATLNDAKLKNLEIYDKQYDRQQQAVSNTRTQNIDILKSISDKYAKNRLQNQLERVYGNLYPSFMYDNNLRTNPTGVGGGFNIPGYGNTGGIPGMATPGFNPMASQNYYTGANVLGQALNYFQDLEQKTQSEPRINKRALNKELRELDPLDNYDYPTGTYAKMGKSIKKDRKNSNILKAFKNL